MCAACAAGAREYRDDAERRAAHAGLRRGHEARRPDTSTAPTGPSCQMRRPRVSSGCCSCRHGRGRAVLAALSDGSPRRRAGGALGAVRVPADPEAPPGRAKDLRNRSVGLRNAWPKRELPGRYVWLGIREELTSGRTAATSRLRGVCIALRVLRVAGIERAYRGARGDVRAVPHVVRAATLVGAHIS